MRWWFPATNRGCRTTVQLQRQPNLRDERTIFTTSGILLRWRSRNSTIPVSFAFHQSIYSLSHVGRRCAAPASFASTNKSYPKDKQRLPLHENASKSISIVKPILNLHPGLYVHRSAARHYTQFELVLGRIGLAQSEACGKCSYASKFTAYEFHCNNMKLKIYNMSLRVVAV